MIISLALLLPIVAVLYWIYIRTGKHKPCPSDYLRLILIFALMVFGTVMTHWQLETDDGGLWAYIVAPMVGYGILLAGIGLAFWIRR